MTQNSLEIEIQEYHRNERTLEDISRRGIGASLHDPVDQLRQPLGVWSTPNVP